MIDTDDIEVPGVEEGRETLFDAFTDTVTRYPIAVAGLILVLVVIALVKAVGGAAVGIASQFKIAIGIIGMVLIAYAFFTLT